MGGLARNKKLSVVAFSEIEAAKGEAKRNKDAG